MTKLITASELERMSEKELRLKFYHLTQALHLSEQGSVERTMLLASLQNVERALCRRMLDGPEA